jgi:hypothetical protein
MRKHPIERLDLRLTDEAGIRGVSKREKKKIKA